MQEPIQTSNAEVSSEPSAEKPHCRKGHCVMRTMTYATLAIAVLGYGAMVLTGCNLQRQAASESAASEGGVGVPPPRADGFTNTAFAQKVNRTQGKSLNGATMNPNLEIATFGAGCFWGVESEFRKIEGVTGTSVGYMGGHLENPTYKQVCTDRTGHAEVVQIEFDPTKVSYETLVDTFFRLHDPTQVNRQGPDVGSQYRTVVFAHSEQQAKVAEQIKRKLDDAKTYPRPIATNIEPAKTYYRAEEYHQQYLEKRGLASCTTTLGT